jgi:starch synthase (maltosyl-transferring)
MKPAYARIIKPAHARNRVVVEDVTPQIDAGRYPVRRIVGDKITVTAAVFGDGHDHLGVRVLYRPVGGRQWYFAPMQALGNDIWRGFFAVNGPGEWEFTVQGWVDRFESWASDTHKRIAAQNNAVRADQSGSVISSGDISLALRTGAVLLKEGARRAHGIAGRQLSDAARELEKLAQSNTHLFEYPLSEEVHRLMSEHPDLAHATQVEPEFPLWVDRPRARFSAWYELFPRSASPVPGQHGTFADVERQLPEIAAMGFDILYMPPIHPIGRAFRKGPNNTASAPPGAPGSPWAIGDAEAQDVRPDGNRCRQDCGGHKSIHPELGTFADFDDLIKAAASFGIDIALDIAFQCSPDHPWVKEHPSWFVIRPDGSIQYAENPPKKYQDIYPLNFETSDWRALWDELYSVFEFWIDRGVRAFRVDNPHTKALPFWEWCLHKLSHQYPEIIYLAEAFTRPHVMYGLAKRGFTQSYTYFTWRNSKKELEEYLQELTKPPLSEFFRPNFWPNTPDILHRTLQEGGPPAFAHRVILAATLAASYGIYGPAYELAENAPAAPAPGRSESEEYLHSEKYEIRQRSRKAPGSLVPLITKLNSIRRDNPALQSNDSLHFHSVDNPNLICYSKSSTDLENVILVVVNLDSFFQQSGWTDLELTKLNLMPDDKFIVQDLLHDAEYAWTGRRNYVTLQPGATPAHVFRVVRQP